MKRFKIKMHLSIGFLSDHQNEEYFEVEDNATPEYIEELAQEITKEWSESYIELGYSYEAAEGQQNG